MKTVWADQLTPDQRTSKMAGLSAYNIGNNVLAAEQFEAAAWAGDSEAQYYLGEIERHKTMLMSPAARFWYIAAAQGGDLFAMLRLIYSNDEASVVGNSSLHSKTSAHWHSIALHHASIQAREGSAEAMLVLYFLEGSLEWLVRSARAGLPEGQFTLARVYRSGAGVFFDPSARNQEVRKWLLAAASRNHVPAMRFLISDLKDYDYREAMEWARNAIRLGDLDTTYEYNQLNMGEEHFAISSYGLLSLIDGAEVSTEIAEKTANKMTALRRKMTPQQLRAGEAFAEEWKKTHPPLSRFLPKYGY